MSGRAKKLAAIAATAAACAAHAAPHGPVTAGGLAGATVRDGRGWSASLFVNPAPRARVLWSDPRGTPDATVDARISRRLTKTSRVTLDVFNVLDHAPAPNALLPHGHAPRSPDASPFEVTGARGVRLNYRWSF